MIGMDEARRLVDRRLERLGAGEDGTVALKDATLLCPDSDVYGPDLVTELATATVELLDLMANARCKCPDSVGASFNCAYHLGDAQPHLLAWLRAGEARR